MNLRSLFTRPNPAAPDAKSSAAGPMIAWTGVGQPRWTPRRYDQLAEEGFRKNVIAYRCVMHIATACAAVPWMLYDKQGNTIDQSPLLDLLRHPNPLQDGVTFLESVYAYLEIAGNAYIEAVMPRDRAAPVELYVLRPDRMKVIPGATGLPEGYQYSVNGQVTTWQADPITGASPILHLKRFHPLDDWYGLAPMEAALLSIDQHNAAGSWNQALLNQGARPSGALVYAPKDGPATLTDDQIQRLREEMGTLYQGNRNAGRPLILEGGLDWREMSLSPKDMDWLAGRDAAAKDIALAFGVPAQLIGIPGAQTYANMAEARLAFYEETVLPILTRVIAGFDHWLTPQFDDNVQLDFDPDQISALSSRRQSQWQHLKNADFLTRNEKRAAAGYPPMEDLGGGDDEFGSDDDDPDPAGYAKFNPNHDELGRFTFGSGATGDNSDDDNGISENAPSQSSSLPSNDINGTQVAQEILPPDAIILEETPIPETTERLPGMEGGPPLPQNPFDLLKQGYEDISDPNAAQKGHYTFRNPQTGDTLRFDEGTPGENGFQGKDHYHRLNPDNTDKTNKFLDRNGNPVRKGTKPYHLLPGESA